MQKECPHVFVSKIVFMSLEHVVSIYRNYSSLYVNVWFKWHVWT